jgi:hypothetical protein
MVLRVGLDLDQKNSAIRQLKKFVNGLEAFDYPTECAHILKDVKVHLVM